MVPLAHGPIGPLDELVPAVLPLVVMTGLLLRSVAWRAFASWRDRSHR